MVVVKGALDFQLLLQVTLKLLVDVVHHWLIAAKQTNNPMRNLSLMSGKSSHWLHIFFYKGHLTKFESVKTLEHSEPVTILRCL